MLTLSIGNEGIISLTQNLNAASKTDIVLLSSQPPLPQMPALAKEYHVVHVAPDFDDSLDLMDANA